MGPRLRAALAAMVLLIFLAPAMFPGFRGVSAAAEPPDGPDRFALITQNYILYKWWVSNWTTNKVVCELEVDHEGLPTGGDIFDTCGDTIYKNWIATKSCGETGCYGYYLQLLSSEPATRKVSVALPPPVVWMTLQGCVPENSTFRCNTLPSLILTGEEPVDGEHIINLGGDLNGKSFLCDPICQVDLIPTGDKGLTINFWAYSSYGDSSEPFQARVRVIPSDDANGHFWYADVLSSQWRGTPLAAGSLTWDAYPPVGGAPTWLSTPLQAEDLATSIPYEYLASRLIEHGVVDASSCPENGLLEDGTANQCGLELARSAVNDWQNRFDSLIFTTAQTTGIPAQLLKNIFARESQFWPGVSKNHPEAGLGQMTKGGADTTLLWNRPFFEQFCASVFDETICQKGYAHISLEQQETLDDALVNSVDAFCPDCPLGIDISRAENSVEVFAETLLANTQQAGMIVYNTYGVSPGDAAGYEDLWRFTLVNYNAGPGCLTLAIRETQGSNEQLNWQNLSSHFTPVCRPALDYVNEITSLTK